MLPLDGVGRHGSLDELLSDLADTVMVGDGATAEHDLVTGGILDVLVHINDCGAVIVLVIDGQVNVDGRTSLINLRHAERDPESVLVEASLFSGVVHSLPDALGSLADLGPRAGELEGLAEGVVLHGQVSRVGNQEGEQVASHAVLGAANQAAELLAQIADRLVSAASPGLVAFEEHRACSHLVRIKALDLGDVEFLGGVDELVPLGVLFGLEGSAELELSVVDEAD
mmetsp:Transcript_25922/g.34707  ORF Transcript_25922/g.34707 Transcript_25922/m.34707 type:complete len:227 (+) Transcript_25922:380-1060(+)